MRIHRCGGGRRILALALCIGSAAGCAAKDEPKAFRPLSDGEPVPAYAGALLSGDSLSLASVRGDVVVLNVWATWCVPCRREMPLLDSLSREYAARGVRVIGVSIDGEGTESAIREFVKDYTIGFPIVHDKQGKIQQVFKMRGVPETFLVDRQGLLRRHWVGGIDGPDAGIREAIERIL